MFQKISIEIILINKCFPCSNKIISSILKVKQSRKSLHESINVKSNCIDREAKGKWNFTWLNADKRSLTGHDGRLTARKNCLGNWQYHERQRVTSCIVPLAWRSIIEHFQFSHLDNQTNFPIQFSGGARKSLSRGSDNWIERQRGCHWYEISEWAKLYARWSPFVRASKEM